MSIHAKMIWINQCSFIIIHWILYKQVINKNSFLFKFVLYSIRSIFFRDSKFISSLEKWTSKNFMNIVIDNSLNRWNLRNFIKNNKNEITFSDCLKHFHKVKIPECHIVKQNFVCIFNQYRSTCVHDFQSAMSNCLISTSQDDSWIDVVINARRVCIFIEKMLFVLKSLIKYQEKTWYYRVEHDCNKKQQREYIWLKNIKAIKYVINYVIK